MEFFVRQANFNIVGPDFNMEDHLRRVAVPEYASSHVPSQEIHMVSKFSELALSGKPDPFWPEIALKTQIVLDAILESARNDGQPVEPSA